jgi:phage tail-like protein
MSNDSGTAHLGLKDLYALGYRFEVVFQMGGTKPHNFEMVFQKVSGIAVSRKVDFSKGETITTEQATYEKLTLTKGLSLKRYTQWDKYIWSMQEQAVRIAAALLVSVLDEDGEPVRTWKFFDVLPTRWSLSELDAGNTAILIETLEVQFRRMNIINAK